MDDIKKILAYHIKTYRGKNGQTQEELAFCAGISTAHLARIERERANITLKTVEQIAKGLQVPVDALFRPVDDGEMPQAGKADIGRYIGLLEKLNPAQKKMLQDILIQFIMLLQRENGREEESCHDNNI